MCHSLRQRLPRIRIKALSPGKPQPKLVPFGEINPLAPNWESELDRCATVHHMPGVRLHPNYHNYKLDHPNFASFLKAAAERKLIVQLTILMEDARMMHPLMRVPPVDIAPLEKLVSQTPGLRLVLLNALTSASRTDKLYRLTNAGEVYVEIAMLETLAALESLVKDIPVERHPLRLSRPQLLRRSRPPETSRSEFASHPSRSNRARKRPPPPIPAINQARSPQRNRIMQVPAFAHGLRRCRRLALAEGLPSP